MEDGIDLAGGEPAGFEAQPAVAVAVAILLKAGFAVVAAKPRHRGNCFCTRSKKWSTVSRE